MSSRIHILAFSNMQIPKFCKIIFPEVTYSFHSAILPSPGVTFLSRKNCELLIAYFTPPEIFIFQAACIRLQVANITGWGLLLTRIICGLLLYIGEVAGIAGCIVRFASISKTYVIQDIEKRPVAGPACPWEWGSKNGGGLKTVRSCSQIKKSVCDSTLL
jgi:hypothetical protein